MTVLLLLVVFREVVLLVKKNSGRTARALFGGNVGLLGSEKNETKCKINHQKILCTYVQL